jgi:hypothetical protein
VEGPFYPQIDPIRSRVIGGRRAHSEKESRHLSSVTLSWYTLEYILLACYSVCCLDKLMALDYRIIHSSFAY